MSIPQERVQRPTMAKHERMRRMGVRIDVRTYSIIIALIGIWILFTVLTQGVFLAPRNLSNLFVQSAETAILAVGVTLVIVAAQIDLSVGSLAGLSGGLAAIAQAWWHWNVIESILLALLVGVICGLFQGWWVAYQNVPAFIVTLGGMLVFRGILIGLTNGQSVSPLSPSYDAIGQSYINPTLGTVFGVIAFVIYCASVIRRRIRRAHLGFEVRPWPAELAILLVVAVLLTAFLYVMNSYHGIPVQIFILLLLVLIFSFISFRTRFGRHVYAIGGNVEAARISGIPVRARILSVFVLSGLLAAVTGIVLTARMDAGTVDAGTNFELNAIAACVIGGTSLMGGVGTVSGAVIGALVMGSIDNGMSLLNAAPFWQYVVKGLILIVAVWIDIVSKRRQTS